MARKDAGLLSVGIATLLALAGGWVVTATADAAYTWEGTWSSTFGDITMDASGKGTYPGGEISGGVSGVDGRTNSGTWEEASSDGTYVFNMSTSGQGFDGTYERSEGGCVFPPCDWDGLCELGACLANGPAPAPGYEVVFGFELLPGLPSKVPREDLPRRLVSVRALTDATRLVSDVPISNDAITDAEGDLRMTTRYRRANGDVIRHRILFRLVHDGFYDKSPGEVTVQADMEVVRSDDEHCPAEQFALMQLKVRKLDSGEKVVKLTIGENEEHGSDPISCLRTNDVEDERLIWTTDDFRSVKIGPRRQIEGS